MNKRIEELANISISATRLKIDVEYLTDFRNMMEKFSELIVRECAWAADFADKNPGNYVLKHFGVEE